MSMSERKLSFKSPEGQEQYLAAYDAVLALWPVPYQSQYIETSHGVTHVITCGPADAPPVVLLHAYLFSSTEWYANVEPLAANHRVYIVDVMGDMTQSVPSRPFRKRAETAVWLGELLDALGIQRTIMIGHSYGGWLTINFALHAPERLERIVLLAPAASLLPMVGQFTLRRLAAWLFPKRGIQSFVKWCAAPGNRIPDSMVQQMVLAVKHYRYTAMPPMPDVYTDEELTRIQTPCLLLVGEQ
jgi:pimeloyl-ACP methyl ester carboxylesterase